MKLSELQTGDKAVIVKVSGHGGFRKRIIEMGFIKGQVVEVLLNAPLQDPVKYKLMGYEVSLRHDEAKLIEVRLSPMPLPIREGRGWRRAVFRGAPRTRESPLTGRFRRVLLPHRRRPHR